MSSASSRKAYRSGQKAFTFTKLKSIVIPDSVTDIGEFAFKGCEQLQSAVIGNGLKVIILAKIVTECEGANLCNGQALVKGRDNNVVVRAIVGGNHRGIFLYRNNRN